jgi:hypothetical protein
LDLTQRRQRQHKILGYKEALPIESQQAGRPEGATATDSATWWSGDDTSGGSLNWGTDFRSETNRTRLQVEVEHLNLPAGAVLTVLLHSGTNAPVQIGQIMLSGTGFGELELDSEHGDAVPAVHNGDVVSVAHGATAILAGAFGPA